MDATELNAIQRRLRRAYEWARVRRALLGVSPLTLAIAVVVCVSHRPEFVLALGVVALLVGAGLLWYGREPQRALVPGVVAGAVPLTLALVANQVHTCGAGGCGTWCVPACVLGGVVAGLAVASVGNARRAGPWFWVSASSMALLTGAMGCACVGYAGVVGLALGFGAGMVPGILRRALGGGAT
jgi:hypothetical protein